MDESLVRVVLDTNILVSAIIFGGKPNQILSLIIEEEIQAVTSSILLAELEEVVYRKFPLSEENFKLTFSNIRNIFQIVRPKKYLRVVKDNDDNRVLEAAVSGKCQYIVTGDKELLGLKLFRGIKIVLPNQFLKQF